MTSRCRTRPCPRPVVTIALGSAAFSTLSYAVAPTIRTAAAIQPFIQLVLLPLYFISGVLDPPVKEPGWVNDIATVFPLQHVAHGLHRAFDPTHSGLGISGVDLLVLGAWTALAFAFAVRTIHLAPARNLG